MSRVRVLVTGGVRSGKSRHAENLLWDARTRYVAAGPTPSEETDPDWVARVATHRDRRPAWWSTLETHDLADAITTAEGPVLVDCLGTWLTGLVDRSGGWDWPDQRLRDLLGRELDPVVAALTDCGHDVVLVTNEVGYGVVPEHRSGRVFRDLLGTANQEVAAACDEVHLVVAGRVLVL